MLFIDKLISDLDNFSVSESKTCEVESCKQYLSSFSHPLTFVTQNIQSIYKNFDNFNVLLHRLNFNCDIIVLTECFLQNRKNLPLMQGYNRFNTLDNFNKNGGIVVYTRNTLDVSVEEPTILDCNRLLIKIGSEIAVLAIYRSPSHTNTKVFTQSLNETLQKLSSYKNIVMLGDINIDIRPENENSDALEYLNLCAFNGLLPAHTLVTRPSSGTCLDHIMIK